MLESSCKRNQLMSLFRIPQKSNSNQSSLQTLKKKIKPNQQAQNDPLYKILSWREQYQSYILPPQQTYIYHEEHDICQADSSKWGSNLQGIFINVDWNHINFNQFQQIQLENSLISNGIVFVWGAKNNIAQLMSYFYKKDFFYVENLTFVILDRNKINDHKNKNTTLLNYFAKKNTNNVESKPQKEPDYRLGEVKDAKDVFVNGSSSYFRQTQKVLYMFRKNTKKEPLELRHQRTSDVYFTINDSQGLNLDWRGKQIVYKMIETLLINANYKQNSNLQLLELWGDKQQPRKGWITIIQNSKHKDKLNKTLDVLQ